VAGSDSDSLIPSFFVELRRRRVIRIAVVYAIIGWVVIEVASTVLPHLNLPDWAVTLVIVLVALGFPIAVIMGWMFDIGPHGVERTAPLAEAPNTKATKLAPSQGSARPAIETPKTLAKADPDRRTIAVLPFVNMSGDAENEYFSDGISEEILNLLTKLPQLKVSSRTSSFFFKGKEIDIPMVAAKLDVGTVLEGSVRRAGDRVRITAQLIDVESDSHLWSETYDREFKDVFAIQDDIAKSIVDALQVTLSPKERRAIQSAATSDVQAYDFYLRGRKFFYAMNRRDYHHAISMYEHAIKLDPKYAAAWAGLADTYSYLYRYADASPENVAKAIEASGHAVQLEPDSAEAHASKGLALSISKQPGEAERHFEMAMMLNPNLFEAYVFYGRYCSSQGNFEKAARLYTQASEVNPADYNTPICLSMAYAAMGRRNEELDARRRALQLAQQHLQMNPDDARVRYLGAGVLAVLGEKGKAAEWADLALQLGGDEPNVLYNVACVFAQLAECERAMDLLERAVKLGWGDRTWIETDSDLASLRDNPRFKALLASIH
jgi:adenylate cyclase